MSSGIVDKIRAAGGEVYAVTSEPQRLADKAQEDWGLNFECVGDPHQEISATCIDRGWLQLFVNTNTDLQENFEGSKFSHPKGYFQPGVLALDGNGRVLYRWRSVPTRKNMGGAAARPTAKHVYSKLSAAQQAPASSDTSDAELDDAPELDMRGIPWPLFVSVLTAHGWFIKPKPFPHVPGGASIQKRFLGALLRIPFFIALWIAALYVFPTVWVGVAFAAWAVWLTQQIHTLGTQFQNVKPPE